MLISSIQHGISFGSTNDVVENASRTLCTLSELMNRFEIKDDDLDKEVCDGFLQQISLMIDNWNPFARQFGLNGQEITDIEHHVGLTAYDRVYETFGRWKSSNITRATYRQFIRTLLDYGHFGLARKVCELLKKKS